MSGTVYDSNLFCPECRTPVEPNTTKCPVCGREVRHIKCPECGTPIGIKDLSTYENVSGRHIIKEFTTGGTPSEIICPVHTFKKMNWDLTELGVDTDA